MAAAQRKLMESTRTEVEAAILVASQAETEAAQLRAQVASLRRSRDRLRSICEQRGLRLAAVRGRPSCEAPRLEAPSRTAADGTPAAAASAAVQTDGASYSLLAQQVSALQAENILFNSLKFQCKNCNAS